MKAASARNKTKTPRTMTTPLKAKGRFNSNASLASALNLQRKSAFDDETLGILDNSETTEDAQTFITSTTDYLEAGRGLPKNRNLHSSFDSSEEASASRKKNDGPSHPSHGSSLSEVRARKRQQEREWELDRQRNGSAGHQSAAAKKSSSRGRNHESRSSRIERHSDAVEAIDDSDESDSCSETEPNKPQSSQMLGSSTLMDETARDGYDSDSYSLKKNRTKLGKLKPTKSLDKKGQFEFRQSLADTSMFADTTLGVLSATSGKSGGNDASQSGSFMADSGCKIKMTKMEKIKQLQTKNERYKEEYKKTYLEKKEFKKKYEDKKLEVASLTSEIESYMRETALLKQQLSFLTSDMDYAENSTRKDLALVAKLQRDLQQTRADLKEALGRIADRKLETTELREVLKRKDEQIETLTLEVSRQIEEVQNLQAQLAVHDMGSTASSNAGRTDRHGAGDDARVSELQDENENIKAELAMTLNRAADMVKNREATIEILRKENHELKELLDIRDQDDDRTTTSQKIRNKEEAIEHLQIEISGLKEMLDQSKDDKDELRQVLECRNAEIKNLKVDIDGLKKMVKRAEKETNKAHNEAEEREGVISSLEEKIAQLETQTKAHERECVKYYTIAENRNEEIEKLKDEIKALKENKEGSSDAVQAVRSEVEEKEEEIKALYRENENLKAAMLRQRDDLDERRKNVVLELEDLKLQEKELQDRIAEGIEMIKARDDAIEDLLREVERHKNSREENEEKQKLEANKLKENLANMTKDMEILKLKLVDKDRELDRTKEMVKEREAAIEDLLRDIEALKQQGSDVEHRIKNRTTELMAQIKKKNEEAEVLEAEMAKLQERLQDAENDLAVSADTLQEREDAIEELLRDMNDLKRKHESERDKEEKLENSATIADLQRELEKANRLIKEKEEKLREVVQENIKLNTAVDTLKEEKEQENVNEKDKKEDDASAEDDSKSFLIAQQEVLEEEIQQLNDQVNELQAELEDAHRQNSILNEEVEDWLQRGGNLELEIQRLKNELEEWQDKAEQLKAAGGDGANGGGNSTEEMGDKQAMLLEKAMAERHRKNGGDGKGVWGLFFTKSEDAEDLTEEQKRIKELEAIKDAQAEEIQKIKSDLVKLTTSSRNESYVSKKKIADLEKENDAYKAKVELLLRRLAQVQGVPYDVDGDEKKVDT